MAIKLGCGLDKQKAVIFACADETQFRGERDYMQALAADIKARGVREDTAYFFCKPNSTGAGNIKTLPLSNADYAAIPSPESLPLQNIAGMNSVDIIAVGNSTLNSAISLSDLVTSNASSPSVTTSYITHMINDKDDLKKITDRGLTVFTPSSREDIAALDAGLTAKTRYVQLDAVPHTNTEASCRIDYDAYMNTPSCHAAVQIVNNEEPFAFVVLNAGFPADGSHIPYTAKEAQEHGAALGRAMPAGTNLILAHGGPRNLLDEEAGHNTMDAFAKAYEAAQAERDAQPQIIRERFENGLPYNIIKGGYLLSRAGNCIAFISNSEGYGTMDGAVLHVNNREKLLGMFPFEALYADPSGQRQANIGKYNCLGVTALSAKKGKLVIDRNPQQAVTPHSGKDAARQIVSDLRLATTSISVPVKARPTPRV